MKHVAQTRLHRTRQCTGTIIELSPGGRVRSPEIPTGSRRGSVLLVVLVVVLLLSLAAYRFSESMVAELQAANAYQRDAEARAFADSAVELASAVIGDRSETGAAVDLYRNPELFGAAIMRDSETDWGRGRFAIVAGEPGDVSGTGYRFGVTDESSRVNINVLANSDLDEEQARNLMMELPQMTAEIADAILDWVDTNTQPRQFGAENEYYGTLNPAYTARNGPIETIDELLKVRGVTPWLLFGEDTNRNGILDPNENDGGGALPPYDDGDGVLWRGWSAYLTSMSREANRRTDGRPRIDVNQKNLATLYDTLLTEFDEETAKFVLAYRLFGPKQQQGQGSQGSSGSRSGRSNGRRGSGSSGSGGSKTGSGTNIGASSDGVNIGASSDGVNIGGSSRGVNVGGSSNGVNVGGSSNGVNVGGSSNGVNIGSGGSRGRQSQGGSRETRAGFDVSGGGKTNLKSLYELIDATVMAKAQGQEQEQELKSPWTSDGSDLQSYLPKLLDTLSIGSDPFIEGRVNINHAPYEVLMTVPGMDAQTAQAIVAAQAAGSASAVSGTRATTGWLLAEGIVDRERMVTMDQYMTTRGDVYRVQSIGYYDGGGPAVRLEAIIDGTRVAPRVIVVKDLTNLGRGFWPEQLGGTSE